MDDFLDHLMLPIVTKVANSGIKNLFRFRSILWPIRWLLP